MPDPSDDLDEDSPAVGGATSRSGLFDRLISGGRPAASRPSRPTTSPKQSVEQLDNRERRWAFIASGASVLFGVMIYVIETDNAKFRVTKGQLTPQTTLIVGVVFGALLFGATLWGRRALVGFAALFTGIAFTNSYLVAALPFLVLAGWLLIRSYRVQKEAATVARAAKVDAGSRPRTDRTASPRSKPGAKNTSGKGPVRPEANKRYTPKRPPPPPPKPSRRQRKADASD